MDIHIHRNGEGYRVDVVDDDGLGASVEITALELDRIVGQWARLHARMMLAPDRPGLKSSAQLREATMRTIERQLAQRD